MKYKRQIVTIISYDDKKVYNYTWSKPKEAIEPFIAARGFNVWRVDWLIHDGDFNLNLEEI